MENHHPSFRVTGFLAAIAILSREQTQGGNFDLVVQLDVDDGFDCFHRLLPFATALRNNHYIESLVLSKFYWCKVDDENSDNASYQVLGEVLGSHPSITRIRFQNQYMRRKCIDYLIKTVVENNKKQQPTRLRELEFSGSLDDDYVVNISRLLRENTQIESLLLPFCHITSDGCNAILKALDGNTHLRELDLSGNPFSEICLFALRGLDRSNLRELNLHCHGLNCVTCQVLAEGLKTNTSLEVLKCFSIDYPESFLVELLDSFNFTLHRLKITPPWINDNNDTDTPYPAQARLNQLLIFNQGVRDAHTYLQRRSYLLEQSLIWPQALERISSKPSLVYRFIRHGNLAAFADQPWYRFGRVREHHSNNRKNNVATTNTTTADVDDEENEPLKRRAATRARFSVEANRDYNHYNALVKEQTPEATGYYQ